MNSIPTELSDAALDARERLAKFSRNAAAENTAAGRPASALTMAAAAREAIFADALLGAMHARFEELKSVAK